MFANLFQIEKVGLACNLRLTVCMYVRKVHEKVYWKEATEAENQFIVFNLLDLIFHFLSFSYAAQKFYSTFNTIFYVHYELAQAAKKAHKFWSFLLLLLLEKLNI